MLFLTYLLVIFCFSSQCLIPIAQSQLITEPPRNTSAPLGRNATFSCCGNGDLVWEISGTQIRSEDQIETFAVTRKIYSPIHQANSTEVFITATTDNNGTTVECLLGPAIGTVRERSAVVKLLVYAEPYPPSDLVIEVNGLNLVVTWTEPFSLEGEEISYVVSITNVNSKRHIHETVHNTTRFVLDDSVIPGPRNCSDYDIGVFSKNGYGQSTYGILGRKPLPTVPPVMGKADVKINIILTGSNTVHAEVMFNPRDPCTAYPVTRYNFTVTERTNPSNTHFVTYTSDASLILDGDNVGLEPDRVYRLSIEAVNSVGRTLSEEILLYTTGLQSSSAVMELDGSITVTCTFATGASSTGCQVTIFNTDNTQVEILSENITRQNGDSQIIDSIVVPGLPESENSMLLVQTAELMSGGQVGSVLFEGTVIVATVTTPAPMTASPTTSASTVEGTGEPMSPFSSVVNGIIGAVVGTIIVLLLLIILSVCVVLSLKRKKYCSFFSLRA